MPLSEQGRIVAKWLKVYGAHYRKDYAPEETQAINEMLWDCDPAALNVAFRDAMRESLEYEPRVGSIYARAKAIEEQAGKPMYPRPKFPPPDHGCKLIVRESKLHFTSVRKMLYQLNRYEGVHVECSGRPDPVCPWCGTTQEPFANPLMVELAKMFPEQTKQWNIWHKGYLLCEACSNLNYPADFVGGQQMPGHMLEAYSRGERGAGGLKKLGE